MAATAKVTYIVRTISAIVLPKSMERAVEPQDAPLDHHISF